MPKQKDELAKGAQKIDELEKELAATQIVSRTAKRMDDQSKAELSRAVSRSLSFAQVLDDLGVSLHQAISATANRLTKR